LAFYKREIREREGRQLWGVYLGQTGEVKKKTAGILTHITTVPLLAVRREQGNEFGGGSILKKRYLHGD